MSCSFCKNPEADSFVTDAGNNAELSVNVHLCAQHLLEYEKDEPEFLSKRSTLLDDMAYDQLLVHADMMRDD